MPTFLCVAIISPSGLNTGEVLYIFPLLCRSGIEPERILAKTDHIPTTASTRCQDQ